MEDLEYGYVVFRKRNTLIEEIIEIVTKGLGYKVEEAIDKEAFSMLVSLSIKEKEETVLQLSTDGNVIKWKKEILAIVKDDNLKFSFNNIYNRIENTILPAKYFFEGETNSVESKLIFKNALPLFDLDDTLNNNLEVFYKYQLFIQVKEKKKSFHFNTIPKNWEKVEQLKNDIIDLQVFR